MICKTCGQHPAMKKKQTCWRCKTESEQNVTKLGALRRETWRCTCPDRPFNENEETHCHICGKARINRNEMK